MLAALPPDQMMRWRGSKVNGLTLLAGAWGPSALAALAVVGVVLLPGSGPRVAFSRGVLGLAFPLSLGGGTGALVVALDLLARPFDLTGCGDLEGGAGPSRRRPGRPRECGTGVGSRRRARALPGAGPCRARGLEFCLLLATKRRWWHQGGARQRDAALDKTPQQQYAELTTRAREAEQAGAGSPAFRLADP